MGKNMAAIVFGYVGIIGYTSGLYGDNGRENGSSYSI